MQGALYSNSGATSISLLVQRSNRVNSKAHTGVCGRCTNLYPQRDPFTLSLVAATYSRPRGSNLPSPPENLGENRTFRPSSQLGCKWPRRSQLDKASGTAKIKNAGLMSPNWTVLTSHVAVTRNPVQEKQNLRLDAASVELNTPTHILTGGA